MYTQANSLIGQLCKEDGEIAETNEEKANKHDDCFTCVYKKYLHNIPNIEMASWSNGMTLADIIIKTPDAIHIYTRQARNLKTNKAFGLEGLAPYALKEFNMMQEIINLLVYRSRVFQ